MEVEIHSIKGYLCQFGEIILLNRVYFIKNIMRNLISSLLTLLNSKNIEN